MLLPKAARVALYVGLTVVDLDTGEPAVLDWEISVDGGATWVPGNRVTITNDDGSTDEVIRFLVAGPDGAGGGEDLVVSETSDVQVRGVDGDEVLILLDEISPITVV